MYLNWIGIEFSWIEIIDISFNVFEFNWNWIKIKFKLHVVSFNIFIQMELNFHKIN
jgi:hypothetical protein